MCTNVHLFCTIFCESRRSTVKRIIMFFFFWKYRAQYGITAYSLTLRNLLFCWRAAFSTNSIIVSVDIKLSKPKTPVLSQLRVMNLIDYSEL